MKSKGLKRMIRGSAVLSLTIILIFVALPAAQASAFAQSDGRLEIAQLGQCKLESGQIIEDCRVGYRTFGQLNPAGNNAILMPTWLYGTSQDLTGLFGDGASPQHLVDTSRFFGIAIDAFANGVSSSPSNSPRQHGTAFPAFTLRDNIRAQYRVLTEVLHLKHLHAVIGLSMGGEQTFVWSVMHPEFFDLAAPILGTPRMTSYDLEVKQIMVETIVTDPAYDNGHYTSEPPLKLANLFGNLVVTSPDFRNQATPRDKLGQFLAQAEAPLAIDANDRLWQLKAIMQQDVIGNRTIGEAARATPVHFLVIVSGEDHLVNPQPALDWAAAIGAPTYISHGSCAHLIMSCDAEAVSSRVRRFLTSGATH
jgi:homoserine O-acetyltransferase